MDGSCGFWRWLVSWQARMEAVGMELGMFGRVGCVLLMYLGCVGGFLAVLMLLLTSWQVGPEVGMMQAGRLAPSGFKSPWYMCVGE